MDAPTKLSIETLLLSSSLVTFKALSRTIQRDVDFAKQALFEYTQDCPADIRPTFFVHYYAGASDVMGLMSEKELEDAKKKHQVLSVHVYSLAKEGVSQDALPMADLGVMESDTAETLKSCRLLVHSTAKQGAIKLIKTQLPSKQNAPSVDPFKSKCAFPSSKNGNGASKTDKKPAPKASKPKVGFFGAVKTAPKSVPAEKSKSDSSKKKKDEAIHIDATPKEQASSVVSAEEMSEEEVKVVKKPAPVKKAVIKNPIKDAKRSAQETQLMDMFNDDEDMAVSQNSNSGSSSTNKLKRVATIDSDNEEDDTLSQKSAHSLAADTASAAPAGVTKRVRKRRKVKKTLTYQEGKYMKTKDVEEWESYSEDEVQHAAQMSQSWATSSVKTSKTCGNSTVSGDAEKTAAPKKGKKGGKAANQKSLLSFFGKK